MSNDVVKMVSVKKHRHVFDLSVLPSGKVEYRIDNGKAFPAKQLQDGKIYFMKKHELLIDGDLVDISGLNLTEEDYAALKDAQNAGVYYRPEEAEQKTDADREKALSRVDCWKKKPCTLRGKKGKKEKCCIHNFRIGKNKYRFVERQMSDNGIVVNPDFKIAEDMPDVGGIPRQHGELMFWDYFYEDEGWKRVRTLTNNELICLDIIQQYGFFAGQEQKSRKKRPTKNKRKPNG